jgi:hypothetical protein
MEHMRTSHSAGHAVVELVLGQSLLGVFLLDIGRHYVLWSFSNFTGKRKIQMRTKSPVRVAKKAQVMSVVSKKLTESGSRRQNRQLHSYAIYAE